MFHNVTARFRAHPVRNSAWLLGAAVLLILLIAAPRAALGLVVIAAILALYWLPTLIGWRRHVPNLGSVFVVNLLAGWTFVGWIIALAMAARSVPADGAR